MPWRALSAGQIRILECVRDGVSPWDCVPHTLPAIGDVNQLIALGMLEEVPPNYRLTALGHQVLAHRTSEDDEA